MDGDFHLRLQAQMYVKQGIALTATYFRLGLRDNRGTTNHAESEWDSALIHLHQAIILGNWHE
jgi:hypothetical protein